MNKKAQAVLYVYFMIAAVIIVTIAAVLAPMGVLFNTKMFTAGEDILAMSQDEINDIDNPTIRARVNSTVASAMAAGENNIDVNSAIFQYAWVVVVVLTALIVFLQTRRLIEVGSGGFI